MVSFLKTHLSDKTFKALTENRPMNKVSSLVDIIDKARERLSRD